QRAAGGRAEGVDDPGYLPHGQRTRHWIIRRERLSGRTDGLPASGLARDDAAAVPRTLRAPLPSRVRELHAGERFLSVDELHDPRKPRDVRIVVDAEIVRADAADCADRRRLGHHERRPSDRAASEVYEVPVVGEAVDAGVLAHRRDDDAVRERQRAKRDRLEEMRHPPRIAPGRDGWRT